MNHPIAQVVALTCHANAFLRGRPVPPFFPGNSTCVFCDRVTFLHLRKPWFAKAREEEIARTPDLWFAYLKDAGISAIRLLWRPQHHPVISDRMSSGLAGGGGTWAMETVPPNGGRTLWLSRWQVWDRNAPERRIWRVSYGRTSGTRPAPPSAGDLTALAARLRSALASAHDFSERHRCDRFTTSFSRAIETVDSGGAKRHGFHKDLAPAGALPSLAGCLLDACQSGWVFGGMGSWNDLGFAGEAQAEYERISQGLFLTLTDVIQAAANASSFAG
jgi:hypothetical protein